MKKAFSFFCSLVIIAIIVAIGYFVYVFTGEFSTDFKTFYVEVDGVMYVKDGQDLNFTKTTRIDVHYTFEEVQSKKLSFSYELLPAGSDFNFTVDGEKVSWLNVEGLEKAFNVESDKDGIALDCSNKNLLEVLQVIYPNSEIQLPEIDEKQNHYKLIVTAEDKRTSVALLFNTYAETTVESISIDKNHITF